MLINEIKIGGVYKTTLNVEFRNEEEISKVTFLVRVTRISQLNNFVEIVFLNDPCNVIRFLNPYQIEQIS